MAEMNYAKAGVANAGLVTGIIGSVLGVLNGGLNGLDGGHGHGHGPVCSENTPVNRFELQQEQRIAQLESEKAELKADIKTDAKFLEFYKYVDSKFGTVDKEIFANREYTTAKFGEQAVMNEKFIGKLSEVSTVVAGQAARLNDITFTAVNETRISSPCCNY